MGNYDEELKRHCMMLAVRQRQEEEEELKKSLSSMFSQRTEENGSPGYGLLMLLAMGGVLWVIDKVDKALIKFMKLPWVREYLILFLTVENLVCIFVAWFIIRRMRSGKDGRI